MRRNIVAANWKMNGSRELVESLVGGVKAGVAKLDKDVEVVIIPPSLYLADVEKAVSGSALQLGVQNVARWESGAYTGEVSAQMASDVGCAYALVGHSERRQLFAEDDVQVAEKVRLILASGLVAIICVGETLEEREAGQAEQVVARQIRAALADVSGEGWKKIVIAYEPVWAIGTGKTATAVDAQNMHANMRGLLSELGAPAQEISLLYGGSVKPDNAAELFAQADIDGGLIGGASLVSDDFVRICGAV
ncbi:triose-phosphate isomerase [Marinobacter zhejiangensis]|uniref:Triosephosphate isomerase n=1 Tax=Marinobacter zhejiangensis TaxID=488535 RepID=A0A1I4KV04_9GAMM|nr:triose-phosphate isomerase [Marinobacter zhejiangensis]SFL82441.1 triosephosphate isomerase [Marinobacter zhejiangensis]